MTFFLTLNAELWREPLARGTDLAVLRQVAAERWEELLRDHHDQHLQDLAKISFPSWPEWPQSMRDRAQAGRTACLEELRRTRPAEIWPLVWEFPEDACDTVDETEPLFLEGPRDDDSRFTITRSCPRGEVEVSFREV